MDLGVRYVRLRFKTARLETRDARPVVSDNRLLFFRGQMLVQNSGEPGAALGTGSTCQVSQPPEVSEGAKRGGSCLSKDTNIIRIIVRIQQLNFTSTRYT